MTSARLNQWAGWTMVTIGALHTVVFMPHPYWKSWLSGDLWGEGATPESVAVFWALPGGFAAVLVVLGLLVAQLGRRGEHIPGYVGWGLGAWALICVLIVGPSGFLTALIPTGLLIAANLRASRPAEVAIRRGGDESQTAPERDG